MRSGDRARGLPARIPLDQSRDFPQLAKIAPPQQPFDGCHSQKRIYLLEHSRCTGRLHKGRTEPADIEMRRELEKRSAAVHGLNGRLRSATKQVSATKNKWRQRGAGGAYAELVYARSYPDASIRVSPCTLEHIGPDPELRRTWQNPRLALTVKAHRQELVRD